MGNARVFPIFFNNILYICETRENVPTTYTSTRANMQSRLDTPDLKDFIACNGFKSQKVFCFSLMWL